MANDYPIIDNRSTVRMVYRRPLELIFCFGLFSILTSLFLFSSTQVSYAQLSSSPETSAPLGVEGANSQLAELEAAGEQYLSAWNNTAFTSQLDVFIAEGTHGGFGIYREHTPANVFRPGETIVLYLEPVGFGHQPIPDTNSAEDGGDSNSLPRTLYLINMTADIIISDAAGTVLQTLENLPTENIISHRQNTEYSLTLTLSQDQPFPVGDYIVTYVVHDQVIGQSFQLDRRITIDDNAITGAVPLPDFGNDSSMQSLVPQTQLEEQSQALGP